MVIYFVFTTCANTIICLLANTTIPTISHTRTACQRKCLLHSYLLQILSWSSDCHLYSSGLGLGDFFCVHVHVYGLNLIIYTHTVQHYLDCRNAYESGERRSGVYTIRPVLSEPPFDVYCNMETDGGGWTVFQRRQDGSQDFHLYWNDYERGFGNLTGEFWLGLSKIHRLTASAARSELRVDLKRSDGNTAYAIYMNFGVGDSASNYALSVAGYTGTAGDALTSTHNGRQFSTRDRDNDAWINGNCAASTEGGWWFRRCFASGSLLNGQYNIYVRWLTWQGIGRLIFTEMKVRSV